MPPIIVAVAAAAAYAGATALIGGTIAGIVGAGFIATTLTAVVGALVASAVGYGLSAVFGLNRPKAISSRAQDRKQTIRSSIAPRQVVYGTVRVSGPIVYASSSGDAKQFLHLVIPVAGHRVDGPLALWINDERIPWVNGMHTTGKYANKLRTYFAAGEQTTANGDLVAETGGEWTSAHVLRETAYMYVRLEYDRDVFSNGPGALSVELRGHNQIVDPRTNVTGYSNNPALCILHYLTSADGLACGSDEIDTASFIAAANVCDELVTIAANGTTQRRYTLDGAFTLDQKPIDVLDDMLSSCAGTLVYVQGRYRLYAGAYDAPTDTLTASDLAGPAELVTKPPRRELFNTVRGTFINPSRNWQASEFPAYSETAIVTADGETITRDVEWPFTTDETRAQRLAKLTLRRAREALTVRVPVKYAGLRYCVWQTLNVTLADFGWTNKPFRIVAWTFDAESGIINLTLREESANSYAWQFGDAQPLPLEPDTNLVDPLAIPAPTNVAVAASTALQADGSVAPALLVTWTASAFAFLIAHEVQWRVTGTANWNSAEVPVGTNRYTIAPVLIGTTYDVRVRGVTGLARGAWSTTITGTGAADTTAPDAPTNLTATGITRGISVAWTLPTASDLAAVEVWENTSTSTAGRYFVGETRGTGFVRTGLNPNVTRHYWARSRDLSGNLSAYVGPVTATTSLLVADDIENGILNTAKFAAGITPVEIVGSLPSTGNFEGRMVFLTTDDKLYRWTGSAWTAAVPAVDITGQITATQISDGAISTPKLAANAVTAATIAANAITSDKISANAVTAGKIAAAAISSTEIAAGAIRATNLASETLITQAAQLGTAVVGTAQIANLAVNSGKITDLAVETLKIAGNAVTVTAVNTWGGIWTSTAFADAASVVIGDTFGGNFIISLQVRGVAGAITGGGEDAQSYLPGRLRFQLKRGGAVLRTYDSHYSRFEAGEQLFSVASVVDAPGAGSITYTIAIAVAGNGGVVQEATIAVQQVKR